MSPVAEPKSVEQLEGELHQARGRLRKLKAAVEAEEGTLVRSALAEAEESAAADQRRPLQGAPLQRGARPTEQRLRARIVQAEQLLKKEHAQLKTLLQDGNVRLALAIDQGVEGYFSDVHTKRQMGNPVHGPVQEISQAGTMTRRLVGERARLADAVRSLGEECEALAGEAHRSAESKHALVESLHRRDAMRAERYGAGGYAYGY